jgi:hypothetical protein
MSKEIKVSDEYRTNPLSHKPGGSLVKVYKADGTTLVYDKIKYPKMYVAKLAFKDDIVQVDVNGSILWKTGYQTSFW